MKIEIITLNAEFEEGDWSKQQIGDPDAGGSVVLRFGNVEVARWQVEQTDFAFKDMETEFVTSFVAAKLSYLFKEL